LRQREQVGRMRNPWLENVIAQTRRQADKAYGKHLDRLLIVLDQVLSLNR
jgi:hypothetical protein